MKISLRGDIREFESGMNPYDIAKSFGGGFFKNVCAAKVNGENADFLCSQQGGNLCKNTYQRKIQHSLNAECPPSIVPYECVFRHMLHGAHQ